MVLVTQAACLSVSAEGIQFEEGKWADILAKAKAQNKPVFVDAYTTWCGPCKQMSAYIFPDSKVGAFYNQNFINAKIDMEKGEGIKLAEQYAVAAYPTLLFLDGDGNMLHIGVGSRTVADFIALGQEAMNPVKRLSTAINQYQAGDRDPKFLADYVLRLDDASRELTKPRDEYFKSQSEAELVSPQNWKLIRRMVYDPKSREFQYLIKHTADFSAKYGADTVTAKIFDVYYDALINAARRDKSGAEFTALKKQITESGFSKAGEIGLLADMEVYKLKQEWVKYAHTAVKYYAKYPGPDSPQKADELNNEAYTFYEKIADKGLLKKALAWSERSLKLAHSANNLDTYASLHYKLGHKKEALKAANEAIEAAKKTGADASGTMELLGKIHKMK